MNNNLGDIKKTGKSSSGQLGKILKGITTFTIVAKLISDAMKVFTPVLSMLGTIAKLLSLFLLPIVQFITLLLQPLVLALLTLLIPFLQAWQKIFPIFEAFFKPETATPVENAIEKGIAKISGTAEATAAAIDKDATGTFVPGTSDRFGPATTDPEQRAGMNIISVEPATGPVDTEVYDDFITSLEAAGKAAEITGEKFDLLPESFDQLSLSFGVFEAMLNPFTFALNLARSSLEDLAVQNINVFGNIVSTWLSGLLEIDTQTTSIFGTLANKVKKVIAGVINVIISLANRIPGINIPTVRVNDALITKDGKVIEFHPDDDIIASKNGFEGAPVGGNGMTINVNVSALDASSINSQLARKLASEIGRVLQTQQAGRRTYGFNV